MSLHSFLHSLRFRTAVAAVVASGAMLSFASANLLVDPSSGTVRLSGAVGGIDDRIVNGSYALDSNFFGAPLMMNPFATISVNGNLYFGDGDGDGDYFITFLGTEGINRVAPMWGDYKLGATGQIIETEADDYYAVTWLGLESEDGYVGTADLQVIFIEGDTTLGGASFSSGDIIFSYGEISLYSAMPEVIVGLGDALGESADLNEMHGWMSYPAFGAFPVGDGQYILFRPNGEEYDVSIESVIPEPSTYAALTAVIALGVIGWRRHARGKSAI